MTFSSREDALALTDSFHIQQINLVVVNGLINRLVSLPLNVENLKKIDISRGLGANNGKRDSK